MGDWDTAGIKLIEKFIRCDENSKPKSEYYKQVKSKLNTKIICTIKTFRRSWATREKGKHGKHK
jgi:hypothetical protein